MRCASAASDVLTVAATIAACGDNDSGCDEAAEGMVINVLAPDPFSAFIVDLVQLPWK